MTADRADSYGQRSISSPLNTITSVLSQYETSFNVQMRGLLPSLACRALLAPAKAE